MYLNNNCYLTRLDFNRKCKEISALVDMCGVDGMRRVCDLNVTSSSPALATRHIRCVLLVNSPNKLNLLSWL